MAFVLSYGVKLGRTGGIAAHLTSPADLAVTALTATTGVTS